MCFLVSIFKIDSYNKPCVFFFLLFCFKKTCLQVLPYFKRRDFNNLTLDLNINPMLS